MKLEKLMNSIEESQGSNKFPKVVQELITKHLEPMGRNTEIQVWKRLIGEESTRGIPVLPGLKRFTGKSIKYEIKMYPFLEEDSSFDDTYENQDFYDFLLTGLCDFSGKNDEDLSNEVHSAYLLTSLVNKYLNLGENSLTNYGCEPELIAQAVYDYLTVAIPKGVAAKYKADSDAWLIGVHEDNERMSEEIETAKAKRKSQSLQSMPAHIAEALAVFGRSWEDWPYVSALEVRGTTGYESKNHGLIVFLLDGVVIIPTGRESAKYIPNSQIAEIQIGSDLHTEHRGFTAETIQFWTITVVTTDFQEMKRWIYMGTNENEMNRNRPSVMRELGFASQVLEITEGDSWQTEGGTSLSVGYGFGVIQ